MPTDVEPMSLVDRILDYRLAEILRRAREVDHLPFSEIAFLLRTEHDLRVSPETVRVWATKLGIE